MDFEFETKRTALANAFAAAGADWLGYMGMTDTVVAAIPDTQPQKYAVAGTLKGILSMAGKMMGEDGNAGLEGLTRYDLQGEFCITGFAEQKDGTFVKFADVERLLAAPAAAGKPSDKHVLALRRAAECVESYGRDDLAVLLREVADKLTSQPAAEKPTGDLKSSKITDGDSARAFIAEWHRKNFPTDRTFTNYIMGRNKHCALAGDFAWQLAKALESMESIQFASQPQQPDDTQAAVDAFMKWLNGRGALGPGALSERIFIAGWCAHKRHAVYVQAGDAPATDEKLLELLREADDLLFIASDAMLKMGLRDKGSDCGLPHEVRRFALEFSNEGRDGPGALQVRGTGRYRAWLTAARKIGRDAPEAPAGAQNALPEKAKAVLDIRATVNRFLGWRLPKDFSPDSGISFTPYEDALLWPIGTNLFNDGQAKAMLEHCLKDVARPTDDDLWEQTLRYRDTYHEWADKLAEAIAKHFGVDIGEHSNMNCPWSEALDAIEFATPAGAQNAEAIRNQAAETLSACRGYVQYRLDEGTRTSDPIVIEAAEGVLELIESSIRDLQTGSANTQEGGGHE